MSATLAQTTPVDRARVAKLMRAFAYGGRVDDLGKVDDRHNSGMYDKVTWHIALDGATLFGFDNQFRSHLVTGLEQGMTEDEAEDYAYKRTAEDAGIDVL